MAASLVMTAPALAGASICVEDNALGFRWVNGAWTTSNFYPQTYLINEIAPGDPIGKDCWARIAAERGPTEPDLTQPWVGAATCYNLSVVGETPIQTNTNLCTEFYDQGKLFNIACSSEGYSRWDMIPNSEFTIHRTYSVRLGITDSRDDMYLAMGKCSVVTP